MGQAAPHHAAAAPLAPLSALAVAHGTGTAGGRAGQAQGSLRPGRRHPAAFLCLWVELSLCIPQSERFCCCCCLVTPPEGVGRRN